MKYVRLEIEIGPLPDDTTWDTPVRVNDNATLCDINEELADRFMDTEWIGAVCDAGVSGQILPEEIAYPQDDLRPVKEIPLRQPTTSFEASAVLACPVDGEVTAPVTGYIELEGDRREFTQEVWTSNEGSLLHVRITGVAVSQDLAQFVARRHAESIERHVP